jgi:hypothetical protein
MVCCGILRGGSAVIDNPVINIRGGVERIITDICQTEISAVVAGLPQADVEVHVWVTEPSATPPPHLNHIISVRLYGYV